MTDSHDSMTAHSVLCRLATSEDLPKMQHLLAELGGSDFGYRLGGSTIAEFSRWKYFQNPAGEALVGVAVDGDKIVSLAAGVPKRVQVDSKIRLALELGDAITDVSYRRRGLFSDITELICDHASRMGAAFVYSRPNENSFPILVSRAGFQEFTRISERRYVLPSAVLQRKLGLPARVMNALGVDFLARQLVLPPASAEVRVRVAEKFESDADAFSEKLGANSRFSLTRDSKYLNWRYVDSPTPYRIYLAYRENALCGYLVELRDVSTAQGFLVDLSCGDDDPAAATLIRSCIQDMLDNGIDTVSTWVAATKDQSAAARMLTRSFPRLGDAGLHFVVRPLLQNSTGYPLPTSGWRLAMGDFDGV